MPRHLQTSRIHSVALLSSVAQNCAFMWFFLPIFTSLFARVMSAMIIYDKRTLLDIGQRYTNLIQDTLSTNPTWPLEILQHNENKGRLNNPRRRRKHRGRRAGIRNRLRTEAHRLRLTVLFYRVFCSLMSNPWSIIWTILEPGLVSNGTLGTVTSFVWLKHGSRPRSRTLR